MNNNRVNISARINNASSTNKILIVIMSAILLFSIFYWTMHMNKNYLENSKYQTLISPYVEVNKNMQPLSVDVHGSKQGNDMAFSFWLKVTNYQSSSNNIDDPLNILFCLSNTVYVGIDKESNNLVTYVQGHSGSTSIELMNIPFHTWTHYIISVSHQYVNIYLNGQLIKSELLRSSPLMTSTYNVHTNTQNNNPNFTAELGNFYYFGKSLNKKDIEILSQSIPRIPKNH